MGEVISFGAMVQFKKMHDRRKRDKKMVKNAPENSLDELTEVRQVLACLVKGVYDRDKKGANPEKYWKSLGYEPVEDLSVLAEEYEYSSRDDHDDKKVILCDRKVVGDLLKDRMNFGDLARDPPNKARLMLFKRIGEVQPEDAEAGPREPNLKKLKKSEQKLPELVIAIRGTILSEVADVSCDAEIFAETLHAKKHSYMPIVRLIWAISRHYGTVDHVSLPQYRVFSLQRGGHFPEFFHSPYRMTCTVQNCLESGVLKAMSTLRRTQFCPPPRGNVPKMMM
ncbi:hypothetical protein KC19_11G123100 [Ceratodon purpureus]|uniref:Uncharacterized protein n=1 Tax=Ceratodon purpureus TaxID=3225 RepID=A0A8T0GD63_CERPU|nr:hypothetical protein KC19_11G123100 [Ceratodon purpureus]KAG0557356.1 hypothetical protein KC19_11G123100 [Ceratodon purpureus]